MPKLIKDIPVFRDGTYNQPPIGIAELEYEHGITDIHMSLHNEAFVIFLEAGTIKGLTLGGMVQGVEPASIKDYQEAPMQDRNGNYLTLCTTCAAEGVEQPKQASFLHNGESLCREHFTPRLVEPPVAGWDTKEESPMVRHARRELTLLGTDQDEMDKYLKVVKAFADMGHSGGSAEFAVPIINELLQQNALTPVTDAADEWFHHSEEIWGEPGGVWQNLRDSRMLSNDGGKTYWNVDENDRNIIFKSVKSRVVNQCTCPSGDGSLRWPCPVHPPTSDQNRSDS